MKISCALAALLALTACGHPDDATAASSNLAICPLQLTPQTNIPKGARVAGNLTEPLPLWAAEVSFGSPDDERTEAGFASVEQDEIVELPGDGARFHYEVRFVEGDMPYMLVCSYGKDALSALKVESRAVLLVPLPKLPVILCDVTYGASSGKSKASSASCVAGK